MNTVSRAVAAAAAVALVPVGITAAVREHQGSHETSGVVRASLRLADGTSAGTVLVIPHGAHGARVLVSLRVAPGSTAVRSFHGFHVHANDNPANGSGCVADPAQPSSTWFTSVDGHWSQPGQTHGDHDGDMPVQYLDASGRSEASFVTDRFRPRDVIGRAIILHAGDDNYANVPTGEASTGYHPNSPAATDLTARTGNAGDRMVCGVLQG